MLSMGHPIAMDSKYGDKHFDQQMSLFGLNRLFLHAHSIYLEHPKTGEMLHLQAPLEKKLKKERDTLIITRA